MENYYLFIIWEPTVLIYGFVINIKLVGYQPRLLLKTIKHGAQSVLLTAKDYN